MTLREFLTKQNMTIGAFASAIQCSRRSVEYYIDGRIPRKATIDKIKSITGNQVTEVDFYGAAQ